MSLSIERLTTRLTDVRNRCLYGMTDRYGHLPRLIAEHRCRTLLEIGVWDGEHARLMIQEALRQSRPQEVSYHGVDLFDEADPATIDWEASKAPPTLESVRKKLQPYLDQGVEVSLIKGDSKLTLPALATNLPPMDFVFVDGGHSLETVSSDWASVQRCIRPGSIVVFDDYYASQAAVEHLKTGVNAVVDGIDRDRHAVTFLRPVDSYPKPWGTLEIRLVQVMVRTP